MNTPRIIRTGARAFDLPDDANEVYDEALDAFNDGAKTSGIDACEHYLAAIATLMLFDFRARMNASAPASPERTE